MNYMIAIYTFTKNKIHNYKILIGVLLFISSIYLILAHVRNASALTTLAPGDIYIITANSDYVYPGGVDSNGFDFVSRVDLDAGTEIYFADKGWDESLAIPFWRNTTGEGALRYTVPAGGIAAGTVIHYDDSYIPTLPSSGSGVWDMYSIDPITGALTLSTSSSSGFDPSTTGDNILVFQGSAAAPTFLYGIGWSATTTWISTGSPTANNSYIPSGISVAGKTVTTLGSTDNYQYGCTLSGLFSPTFADSIQNASNWNSDNTTPYTGSTCSFDASQPVATLSQYIGQNDPTNNNSINYTLTFDQPIDPSSFTISDIIISGTGSGTVASLTSSDNITWTITVNASSEGTVVVSLPTGSITNPNGNPNLATINTDNSVLYDTSPPAQLAAPDLVASSDTGSSSSDDTTNSTTPEFTGACVDGDTIEIYVDGSPITPTAVCSGSVYSIIPSSSIGEGVHSITATSTDPAGNLSAVSDPLSITIDTIAPSCVLDSNSSFDLSPAINGFVDDANATVSITIDGNTYTANNYGSTWSVASGTISPSLTAGQVYPLDISCVDVAGNTATNSSESFTINRHVDIGLGLELLTQGLINSGNTVTYRATLTNIDITYPYGITDTFFYALVPVDLVAPVPFGQIFPVNNSNIECTNLSMTSDLDSIWHQYQNSYVVVCGFTSLTSINPGESISFDMSFTAGSDLSDKTTLRMLVFDEFGADTDSEIIDNEASSGNDFYGLALNNISSAIYNKPIDTPIEPEAPNPSDGNSSLAATGKNSANCIYIATVTVLLCLFISRRKNYV